MNLVLIRHSKSLVNPNIPIPTWALSDEGVALAKKLNGIEQLKTLDVVYSSLQPKALETAILATKDAGIPIKTDDRLTETTSFTNKFVSPEELEENSRKYYLDNQLSFYDGETSQEALNRFTEAIEDIVKAENDKKNVGIVSHGNVLTLFSAQYAGMNAHELHEKMTYPDIAILNWDKKQFTSSFGDILIG